MGDLQWWHIVIIVAVFVLLFGSKRLPDGARALGRSLRIFRAEVKSMHDDDQPDPTSAQIPPSLPAAPPADAPRPQASTAQQDPVSATSAGTQGQPPATS